MKNIRLLIDTQNAAFAEYPEMELARIFRVLSDRLEHGEIPEKLLDINGNTVGYIYIEETAADEVYLDLDDIVAVAPEDDPFYRR